MVTSWLVAGVTGAGRQCSFAGALIWLAGAVWLAARAGAAEATSSADSPSEETTTSSAQATVLSRRLGRGTSYSRAAPAR